MFVCCLSPQRWHDPHGSLILTEGFYICNRKHTSTKGGTSLTARDQYEKQFNQVTVDNILKTYCHKSIYKTNYSKRTVAQEPTQSIKILYTIEYLRPNVRKESDNKTHKLNVYETKSLKTKIHGLECDT